MRKLARVAGILLAAVASVYSVQVLKAQDAAAPADTAKPAEGDPFAAAAAAPKSKAGTDMTKPQIKTAGNLIEFYSVTDQPVGDFLQQMAGLLGKNVLPSKDVKGTISASLSNVTPRELLDAVLHQNGLAYREQGNFIYVYTADELMKIEKSERVMVSQLFHLNYCTSNDARDMIKPLLSADGQIAHIEDKEFQISAETKTVEHTGNTAGEMIVVSDYPEIMDKVKMVIKEIDARPQQILIEATILAAKLNDDNALGVDFTLLGGVDFQSLTASGSNTNEALNGQIINNPGAGGIVDNGYNATGTRVKDPTRQGGLNVGVVYNNVALFVNALETVTDATVLANPKVLSLNRQPGIVIVGRKDGYLTTTTTQTSTLQTVEYLETGTRLIFKPFIAKDGYVRMIIHPEDSTGSVILKGQNALPQKTTTEITTNVLVKDGHTIVIGGLFRENNVINRSQVPLLGNIPFAGALFRDQSDQIERQEVIILLTPHIIKNETEYSEASKLQQERADKMLIGSRKGMMCWSRDRMAEMSYDKAKSELSQKYPDREKAMWYLDCATSLRPVFPEAYAMKEAVSSEEIAAADQSSIRYFVRRQIMMEEAVAATATAPAVDK